MPVAATFGFHVIFTELSPDICLAFTLTGTIAENIGLPNFTIIDCDEIA